MQDSYTIIEHRHRFAIWAAGRAYSRNGPGHTMAVATKLINESGVGKIATLDDLPHIEEMDAFLDGYFQKVIQLATGMTYTRRWEDKHTKAKMSEVLPLECSYGRAQKLVNVYLKSKLVCTSAGDQVSIAALHPPLDRKLIGEIRRYLRRASYKGSKTQEDFFTALALGESWTSFDKTAYDAHIKVVKAIQGRRPLWGIEWLWKPTAEKE